jgi:hypothetical protein
MFVIDCVSDVLATANLKSSLQVSAFAEAGNNDNMELDSTFNGVNASDTKHSRPYTNEHY